MSFADLTSKHLATLLDEVLSRPIYRDNARKFQEIISKRNGLAMAADIVERAFGVNTKSTDEYTGRAGKTEVPDINIVSEASFTSR
jgi:hypothetical protein